MTTATHAAEGVQNIYDSDSQIDVSLRESNQISEKVVNSDLEAENEENQNELLNEKEEKSNENEQSKGFEVDE